MNEGYTKFRCEWRNAPLPAELEFPELIELRNDLRRAGLLGVLPDGIGYGNVSMRGDRFVISGTQTGQVAAATRDHFSLVESYDIDGNSLSCVGLVAASSESLSHAAIYEAAAEIAFVAHIHHREFFCRMLNRLPTTDPRHEYGTPAMAHALRRLAAQGDGCILMGGHADGVMFYGRSADDVRARIDAEGL